MLKRFFISFLGSFAGICVAGLILFFVFFMSILIIGSKNSGSKVAVEKSSVLRIDFSGVVEDRYESSPLLDRLMGESQTVIPLNDLVNAIERSASDDNIEGIYLECNGASAGLAQIEAIRTAIERFKESGKWVIAYSDAFTQGNYYLAASADSVFLNPSGMVDIHGLSSTVLYFKDLLDKVGVRMQVVKVGTYKSAVEPFILNGMSEANREQLECFLGTMWKNISGSLALDRKVDTLAVNSWADSFCFARQAEDYVKEKIVDRLYYKHQVEEQIAELTGKDKAEFIDFDAYIALKGKKPGKGARIAVLYATGDITESGESGIASDRLVPEILDLADNDDIDGLIMRVNSGGGSAFASEQIWEALQQFKQKTGKPFYVSMVDYAASGGYYISCGADRIYAEPLTLTGSIGIFGLIPDAQTLLNDKLGVHTATVETNKGQLPDFFNAMTPEQAAAMQAHVDRGYELFTKRCADGRHMKVEQIKAIAEGRVWDGATALRLGLVDKLGGLDMALADMAAVINEGTDHSGYDVTEYPKIKLEWYDELLKLNSRLEERAINSSLGEYGKYYRALHDIKSLSPLQCRMEYIDIR